MSFRTISGSRRRGGMGGFMGSAGRSQFRLEHGMLSLILASTAVSLAGWLVPALLPHLVLTAERALKHFELWQPLTALFVHVSLGSFVFDMLFLWLMGSFVERALGRRESIVLFVATGVAGYFATAAVALSLGFARRPFFGADPAMFALMLAPAFIYGRQQVLLFGAMPARADVISWIFCGAWLAAALFLKQDFAGAAGDLIAGSATWILVRHGPRRAGTAALATNLARARLWWLRRRYKVLEGGK